MKFVKCSDVQRKYAGIPYEYKALNISNGEHISEGMLTVFWTIVFFCDSHVLAHLRYVMNFS